MHILHVIDALSIGGAERMLVDLANATTGDGQHRASVCITRQGAALASELHPDVKLWQLGRQRRFDLRAFRALASIVRREQIDVFHAHGLSTFSFLAVAQALHFVQTPIVIHDHNSKEIHSSVPLWFRMWGKNHVSKYVGVYQRGIEWAVAAGVPKNRIQVVTNAIHLSRFDHVEPADIRATFGITHFGPVGLVICGIRYEKGIDVLIKTVAQLKDTEFTLIIMGGDRDPDYARNCRAQTDALGLGSRMRFVGEQSDIPSLIKGADFAVIPSRSESGPLVLIEYLYNCVPFVATRVGDIARQLSHLGIPAFVEPDSPAGLAQELDVLINLSPEERCARGAVGHEIAETYYNVDRVLPRWYEIYRTAML